MNQQQEQPRFEYRMSLHKYWEARFISHLDLMRAIPRALRRTGFPLFHSLGFNPRPRISYITPPLSVGRTSECEIVDFSLNSFIPPEQALPVLQRAMPPGIAAADLTEREPGKHPFATMASIIFISGAPEFDSATFFEGAWQPENTPGIHEIEFTEIMNIRIAALPDSEPLKMFDRAFSFETRISQSGGSPVKTASSLLAEHGIAHHIHRLSVC